uniref:CSON007455 protein n=1 Tax=Culicoides sonorensis TaxID=179676 RepID=A0A336LD54_CULSO
MLKWTVTKRADTNPYHGRRSLGALQPSKCESGTPTSTKSRLGRRSLATISVKDVELNKDKENRYTSTPCINPLRNHALVNNNDESLLSTIALRDVSNITPNSTPNNNNNKNNVKKRPFSNTPVMTSTIKKRHHNAHYSSTLPTFDVEYSPCEIKATPFSALPGLGESYYENARYFRDEIKPVLVKNSKNTEKESETTMKSTKNEENSRFSFKKPQIVKSVSPIPMNINENNEDSLHSSQMGDITLDKMIDAILESARKERPKRSASVKSKDSKCSVEFSPTYTPADDPAADLLKYEDNIDLSPSIKYLDAADKTIILDEVVTNEREVRTPDSPKIQGRKSLGKRRREDDSPPESCHLKRQRAVRRKIKTTTKTNQSPERKQTKCVSSPITPCYDIENTYIRKTFDEIAQIETPKLQIINSSSLSLYPASQIENKSILSTNYSKLSIEITPDMRCANMQASSTPTGEANMIRKCLTFSPGTGADDSMNKRSSVASTKSCYSNSRNTIVKGFIDVAIHVENQKLFIHAIRCKDLQRSTGTTINAYVKVAIISQENEKNTVYQRTAVHRDTNRPLFNHKFEFDLKEGDLNKRLQLAVWHRDRECK